MASSLPEGRSARSALATPSKPASPYEFLLGEDRDLLRPQPTDLHEVAHHGVGLLGVARPIIEDVAVGRVAPQQVGAGERPEEQHPVLEGVRHRDHRRGGAHIADDAEDLVLLVELLHGFGGTGGLVAVVRGDEPELPAVDPTGVIGKVEGDLDAHLHLAAEFLGGPGERRRDAEHDLPVGDPPGGGDVGCRGQ